MDDLLVSELRDKSVVGADGSEFGTLHNVTMNVRSGALDHLIVEPTSQDGRRVTGFDTDADGRLLVPASRVRDVRDHVIVDR